MDTVVEMKNRFDANFIGVIKTNHSKYPKKWLEDTMKEWPPGSHLVLEARLDCQLAKAGCMGKQHMMDGRMV